MSKEANPGTGGREADATQQVAPVVTDKLRAARDRFKVTVAVKKALAGGAGSRESLVGIGEDPALQKISDDYAATFRQEGEWVPTPEVGAVVPKPAAGLSANPPAGQPAAEGKPATEDTGQAGPEEKAGEIKTREEYFPVYGRFEELLSLYAAQGSLTDEEDQEGTMLGKLLVDAGEKHPEWRNAWEDAKKARDLASRDDFRAAGEAAEATAQAARIQPPVVPEPAEPAVPVEEVGEITTLQEYIKAALRFYRLEKLSEPGEVFPEKEYREGERLKLLLKDAQEEHPEWAEVWENIVTARNVVSDQVRELRSRIIEAGQIQDNAVKDGRVSLYQEALARENFLYPNKFGFLKSKGAEGFRNGRQAFFADKLIEAKVGPGESLLGLEDVLSREDLKTIEKLFWRKLKEESKNLKPDDVSEEAQMIREWLVSLSENPRPAYAKATADRPAVKQEMKMAEAEERPAGSAGPVEEKKPAKTGRGTKKESTTDDYEETVRAAGNELEQLLENHRKEGADQVLPLEELVTRKNRDYLDSLSGDRQQEELKNLIRVKRFEIAMKTIEAHLTPNDPRWEKLRETYSADDYEAIEGIFMNQMRGIVRLLKSAMKGK